jgi:diguanylate cyclase (GGDEF)-like protein
MTTWSLLVAFNLVTGSAYAVIVAIIVRGLARIGELRSNRLAVGTAAIFATCAAHHAVHAWMLLAADPAQHAAMMRDLLSPWYVLAIDGAATLAGLAYLGMRSSYGMLLHSPAMFDDAAEVRYRQLAANLPDTVVLVLDHDLRVVLADGAGAPLAGADHTELEGRLVRDALPRSVAQGLDAPLDGALAGGSADLDRVDPDSGAVRRVRIRPLRDPRSAVVGALVLVEDVTEQRAAQARLERSQAFGAAVLDASPDATMITDLATGRLVWSSRDMWEMAGWTPAEAARRGAPNLVPLVVEADRARLRASDAEVADLADGESLILRFRVHAPGGGHLWMSRRATPFGRDRSGVARQSLSVVRDVSVIVDAEHRLEHAALHDPLTGLPNRSLLHDRLTSAVLRAAQAGTEVVVLFCDLDGFKRVNDTEGHAVGDAVLVEVASRLRRVVRGPDTVARVGGDEFVVVVEPRPGGPGGSAGPREDAVELAERIRAELSEPYRHAGTNYCISVSIGMTVAARGRSAEEVLRDADLAMYRAKERGRNRVEEFDDVLRADLVERGRVEQVLRSALALRAGPPQPDAAGARLSVAYQPVYDLDTGELVGFEALARLHDAHGHPVEPGVFVQVAEDAGLITAMGGAVLDDALAALVRRRARFPGERPVWMSVNLSVRQVQHSDMAATIRKALGEHGLQPSDLTVELTESVLLAAGSSALHQLTELGVTGVGVAIDDFGTGYASLTYLLTLPVTAVKIDRSFTAGMATDAASVTIVRAVARLATELGLRCVVEGIESSGQLAALPPGLLGQGYLLGRPAPDPTLVPDAR